MRVLINYIYISFSTFSFSFIRLFTDIPLQSLESNHRHLVLNPFAVAQISSHAEGFSFQSRKDRMFTHQFSFVYLFSCIYIHAFNYNVFK